MADPVDILLFAEDPGAANYAADLPGALAAAGKSAVLLAAGPAVAYLQARQVPFTPVPAGADADAVLARWRPGLVAVGTSEDPRTLGLRLLDAAASRGLPTAGLVDAYANAAHRFRGTSDSPLAHAPGLVIVPDAATATAYAALGLPASRVRACGHPHWDHVRAEAARLSRLDRAALRARLFPGCAPDRPAWVFAAEVSTGLDPAQYRRSPGYTLAGRPESTGRTEIVLDEFLAGAARLRPRPFLALRLHPKNGPGDLQRHLTGFDTVSAGGSPLELLFAADAVVGMTSMLLLEAVLLGRPTFSIVPRDAEKDWLPTIAQGATPCATDRAGVEAGLAALLTPRAQPGSGIPEGDCLSLVAGALASLSGSARG